MKYSYSTHGSVYDDTVNELQIFLCKSGYLDKKYLDGYYSLETEKALKRYQNENNLVADGVYDPYKVKIDYEVETIDNSGFISMAVEGMSREIDYTVKKFDDEDVRKSNPFFNDNKYNDFRKGTIDIIIEYANSSKQAKKIEGVKIRSLGQSISPDGEVVSDVYQFVARDIIEYNTLYGVYL